MVINMKRKFDRKKKYLVLWMIVMVLFGLCGCAKEEASVPVGAERFTDDLGREVLVEGHERVAVLIGSFTDVWMLSGGEVIAAANDAWESLQLKLGEETVNLGSIQNPDVEELLASNPAWASLSAVKNGNYYILEKRLFNLKPNARWGEAYEILADILYPGN